MELPEITLQHLKHPANQVIGILLGAIEKNMRRAHRLLLRQTHAITADNAPATHPEALHDFRVEVRRLRVWLQQSRDLVHTRRRARRQLRAIAQGSNAARDREVMLDLLAQIEPIAPNQNREPTQLPPELTALLRQPVRALRPRSGKQRRLCFGPWLAHRLGDALDLTKTCFDGDEVCLHEARIHIKHMRYLMEPLAQLPAAAAALNLLKSLQTTLGDLHDLHVLRPNVSPWICAQLSLQLDGIVMNPGAKTRLIQQNFNHARDQLIRAIDWQGTHYQAALKSWFNQSDEQRQALDTHLGQVMQMLTSASHA